MTQAAPSPPAGRCSHCGSTTEPIPAGLRKPRQGPVRQRWMCPDCGRTVEIPLEPPGGRQ